MEEKLKPCSNSKGQKQQLILAHVVVRGRKSEFYLLDLETEKLTKKPVAVLLNQGQGGGYTVRLGSMIYNVGGHYLESMIIPQFINGDHHIHMGTSCAELTIPKDGNLQTTDAEADADTDANPNAVCRKGGLLLEPTKFQAAPGLLYPRFSPCCAVLEGKIYAFGGSKRAPLGEVFEPQFGEWNKALPIPSLPDYVEVSDPVIPDHKNHRLLVHVDTVSSLFAYYPATGTWDCLAQKFSHWFPATTLLDDVLYFHTQQKPDCISAYDLSSKAWLKVSYAEYFCAKLCYAEFLTMLPLGNNVLCLANSCNYKEDNQPLKTNLQFILFRVQRTSPAEVLVTLIDGKCFTFDGDLRAKHYLLL